MENVFLMVLSTEEARGFSDQFHLWGLHVYDQSLPRGFTFWFILENVTNEYHVDIISLSLSRTPPVPSLLPWKITASFPWAIIATHTHCNIPIYLYVHVFKADLTTLCEIISEGEWWLCPSFRGGVFWDFLYTFWPCQLILSLFKSYLSEHFVEISWVWLSWQTQRIHSLSLGPCPLMLIVFPLWGFAS